MRLTASVRKAAGAARHLVGADAHPLDAAARLEIVSLTNGVSLIRYSAVGAFAGDTWHPDVAEAKRQAKVEFDVDPSDWTETRTH